MKKTNTFLILILVMILSLSYSVKSLVWATAPVFEQNYSSSNNFISADNDFATWYTLDSANEVLSYNSVERQGGGGNDATLFNATNLSINFGNLSHNFTVNWKWNLSDTGGLTSFSISSINATLKQFQRAIFVREEATNKFLLQVTNESINPTECGEQRPFNLNTMYFLTINRTGINLSLSIFSDSGRTNLLNYSSCNWSALSTQPTGLANYIYTVAPWTDGGVGDSSGSIGDVQVCFPECLLADNFSILQSNGTNFTTLRKGNVAQFWFNMSDDIGLSFLKVGHNLTSDGTEINITVPLGNATAHNASVNVTIIFGNTTTFYVKPYFNDTKNQVNNTVPRSLYTTSNTVSTVPVIGTPIAGSFNTTSTVTWAAVGDVDNNTATYRVYVNGSFNGSTTSTSLTLNLTSDNSYAINVSAFDGTDDSGNSTQVQFIYDNIAPSFTGNESNQTSVTVSTSLTVYINFTDLGSNISSATAEFQDANSRNNQSIMTNTSRNTQGNDNPRFSASFTPTLTPWVAVKFFVTDFAGNTNTTPDRYYNITVNAAGGNGDGGGGGGGGYAGCDAGFANVNGTCVPVGNLTKAERCGDSFCDALLGEDPFNCLKDCPFQAASFTCSDPTKPCLFNNTSFVATIVIGIFVLGVVFLQLQIRSVADAKDKFRQLKSKVFKRNFFNRKF